MNSAPYCRTVVYPLNEGTADEFIKGFQAGVLEMYKKNGMQYYVMNKNEKDPKAPYVSLFSLWNNLEEMNAAVMLVGDEQRSLIRPHMSGQYNYTHGTVVDQSN
jgi:hypothetical protein